MSYQSFACLFFCNTKISEFFGMTKSWALGSAACQNKIFFVAQVLKRFDLQKCCRIKVKETRNVSNKKYNCTLLGAI